jgi:putative transcriptional regulator
MSQSSEERIMKAHARVRRAAFETVLVEEHYPEGRVAARVTMRRDPRTRELSYTPSALRTLDRLRAVLQDMTRRSTPGHVRSLREALGLSQQEFAQRAGVAGQTVSRWERGESCPRGAALVRLSALQRESRRRGVVVPRRLVAG